MKPDIGYMEPDGVFTNLKLMELESWKQRALKAEELIYDYISGKITQEYLIQYIKKHLEEE